MDPGSIHLAAKRIRRQRLENRVIEEGERWIMDLGYRRIEIESRTVTVDFYRKPGYRTVNGIVIRSGVFDCVRMEKAVGSESWRPSHGDRFRDSADIG